MKKKKVKKKVKAKVECPGMVAHEKKEKKLIGKLEKMHRKY